MRAYVSRASEEADMLNIYGGEFNDRGLVNLEQRAGLRRLKLLGGNGLRGTTISHLLEALNEISYRQNGKVGKVSGSGEKRW